MLLVECEVQSIVRRHLERSLDIALAKLGSPGPLQIVARLALETWLLITAILQYVLILDAWLRTLDVRTWSYRASQETQRLLSCSDLYARVSCLSASSSR